MKKPALLPDLIDTAIIIVSIILVQGAIIFVSGMMADFMDRHLLEIILHLPHFEYSIVNGAEQGNHIWDIYMQLRWVAIGGFTLIIVVGAVFRFIAQTDIYGDSNFWSRKIKTSIALIIFLMIFPFLWDGATNAIEIGSQLALSPLYSFDPDNPCGNLPPNVIVDTYNNSPYGKDGYAWGFLIYDTDKAEVVCDPNFKMHYLIKQVRWDTGYKMPEIPDPLEWLTRQITLVVSGIITTVFFNFVRALVTISLTMTSTMIAIMANMLTAMIIGGIPLFLLISQIPRFDAVATKFLSALPALALIPLMSAVVISVGAGFVASVGSMDFDGEIAGLDARLVITWIASVGVLMFAVALPVTLVPLLGNVTMQATQTVNSAVSSATNTTAMMAMGAAGKIGGMLGGKKDKDDEDEDEESGEESGDEESKDGK